MRRGIPIETQRLQLRCGDCRHLFEDDMPVRCAMAVSVAAMGAVRCPACLSANILMGQDRTLAEDRARREARRLEDRIVEWDRDGEGGQSVRAIFARMLGRSGFDVVDHPAAHPRDLSDLCRCLQLLDRLPEWRGRIGEMAAVSPTWAALAARWDELWVSAVAEMGPLLETREAPQTAKLLEVILASTVVA